MSSIAQQIAEQIDEIAAKRDGGLRFPIMSGTVVAGSVDTDEGVCSVVLSINDVADTVGMPGVTLNVVSMNNNGFLLFPAEGSNVLVGEVDGPGKWSLIKCSNLVKMLVTVGSTTLTLSDGQIQMNDGSMGGLPKGPELQKQIDKLNTLVSHIVTVISGAPIPEPGLGSPSALQAAMQLAIVADSVGDFSDIINDNIKQG